MLCIALRLRWGKWRMKLVFFILRQAYPTDPGGLVVWQVRRVPGLGSN